MLLPREENYYLVAFGKDYYVPNEQYERFLYLKRKAETIEFLETRTGYRVALETEFRRYKVGFKKGQVWQKKLESWQGNDPKGSLVRITKIKGNFIYHKSKGKFFSESVILNKLSFLRIFERCI